MSTPLRVQSLVGYGLEVPDVAVAEKFFTTFGLDARREHGALELRSASDATCAEPPTIVVHGGAREKRLTHFAFGVAPGELERFAVNVRKFGGELGTPSFGAERAGLWFQDPWGTWMNLVELVPGTPAPVVAPPAPAGPRVDRHLWQELDRNVKPRRIGHALMFTQDWAKTEAYYVDALGLRVTDRAAGKVTFLSAGTGVRDHHCWGLINSTHRGIQHSSFQVSGFDEIGFGSVQMYKAGYTEGFGVGRHAIASNLFHYTRDPWGTWIEYYADMDQISEAWVSRDWNDLPYIWPRWEPEFWTKAMNANVEPR